MVVDFLLPVAFRLGAFLLVFCIKPFCAPFSNGPRCRRVDGRSWGQFPERNVAGRCRCGTFSTHVFLCSVSCPRFVRAPLAKENTYKQLWMGFSLLQVSASEQSEGQNQEEWKWIRNKIVKQCLCYVHFQTSSYSLYREGLLITILRPCFFAFYFRNDLYSIVFTIRLDACRFMTPVCLM